MPGAEPLMSIFSFIIPPTRVKGFLKKQMNSKPVLYFVNKKNTLKKVKFIFILVENISPGRDFISDYVNILFLPLFLSDA
jgi:hypothetical protein